MTKYGNNQQRNGVAASSAKIMAWRQHRKRLAKSLKSLNNEK
jgi:hypothetical protein